MVFASPIFLFLFLPLVLALAFLCPRRVRNGLLLCASLFFYAWGELFYVLVLIGSIVGNFSLGKLVDQPDPRASKRWMLLAVVANLSVLLVFKYSNFLVDNLNVLIGLAGLRPIRLDPVYMPIGVSFLTFQKVSYILDVYRKHVKAADNLIDFGAYVSFFPQLIAGPIVRYVDVARELNDRSVNRADFAEGAARFVVGLGKKVILANGLAVTADAMFSTPPHELAPGAAWLGLVCYTLQLYFDFSGYSDMAIGMGRMFGFRFRENFRHPYIATSMTELWKRWHISLTTWFRDYVYAPLRGKHRGGTRLYVNILIVFLLSGLWHGASWMMLLWGLTQGLALVVERLGLEAWIQRRWRPLRHAYTLLLFGLPLVLFRAESTSHAGGYYLALFGFGSGAWTLADFLTREVATLLVLGVIASLPVLPKVTAWSRKALEERSPLLGVSWEFARVASLMLLLFGSSSLLMVGSYNPFIYFRF